MQLDHFGMYPERAFMKVAGRMTLEGGGGKGGSAPPPPDYAGAARETAAGNKEAAIAAQAGNMINQYTPQGSVEYAQRGEINGTPLWSQTVKLSPEQQAAYNKDVAMNAALQDVGATGVGYVQKALDKPLSFAGMTAIGTPGEIQKAASDAGAKVRYVIPRKFRQVEFPDGKLVKAWELYEDALEADVLINLPIAKHHSICQASMAMNWQVK